MLQFKPPLSTTFCPLVPDASSGRRGLFNHTSNSLNHVSANVDIVVFNEGNFISKSTIVTQRCDLLNEAFARFVFRMCFTSVDKLNRAIGVLQNTCDTIELENIKFARL